MDTNQCALLTKISEYQFICIELNLYLDTHPEDDAARSDYYCYSTRLNELIAEYETLYGPLMNFGHSPTQTGCYVTSRWPWE